MAEEFEESEVIFPDQEEYFNIDNNYYSTQEQESINPTKGNKRSNNKKMIMKNNYKMNININVQPEESWKTRTGSQPIEIPIRNVYEEWLEEEYDGGEVVPPHVIIGMRRVADKMAFSVCTGNGRTLKGRDLSHVRNSVLKLTGFLET